jgi:hypothetical protein
MSEFITLTCPSCGGKLQITEDVERFACVYCGNEQIVKRGNGIVSLSPVVDGLNKVQIGTDRTASELAVTRLNNEIRELEIKGQMLVDQSEKQIGQIKLQFQNETNGITARNRQFKITVIGLFLGVLWILSFGGISINSYFSSNIPLLCVGSFSTLLGFVCTGYYAYKYNKLDHLIDKQKVPSQEELQQQLNKVQEANREYIKVNVDDEISRKRQELNKHLKILSG